MKALLELVPHTAFATAYFFYPDLPAPWREELRGLLQLEAGAGVLAERIYFATATLMLLHIGHCATMRLAKILSPTHLGALALWWLFGGLTLLLQNPILIQWSTTVWHAGMVLLFAWDFWNGHESIIERNFDEKIWMQPAHWHHLDLIWASYFALCGLSNLLVAYVFAEETWVLYRLFGLAIAAPILMGIVNILYTLIRGRDADNMGPVGANERP